VPDHVLDAKESALPGDDWEDLTGIETDRPALWIRHPPASIGDELLANGTFAGSLGTVAQSAGNGRRTRPEAVVA
jgi:hypothetical protein